MLKSTHQPLENPASLPLLPGWTEHTAPTGHPYYYHAETKKSTYVRPEAQPEIIPQYIPAAHPYNNPFGAPFEAPNTSILPNHSADWRNNQRGGHGNHGRRRHQPEDRPKHRHLIPGCAPWILVKTKLGRRFVHNTETRESLWKFPPDVLKGVIEYDRVERQKKERRERGEPSEDEEESAPMKVIPAQSAEEEESEYEEVEVTDDEASEDEGPTKRQRVEGDGQPIEFDEDDIAYQLAAMEHGFDEDEEGAEEEPLSEADAHALFGDLLEDFSVSPYWTWEKVIDDERIVEDDRYTVFPNTKARKDAFGEWCKSRLQILKEQREREEKKDPRIPYIALLDSYATPKLYWPEFKRKYKKEAAMRNLKLSEKDKEKLYREHISRLKLPQSTLKADLKSLLESISLSQLHRSSAVADLPTAILVDARYISLPAKTRDSIIEAYISTLPPAPADANITEEEQAAAERRREERKRRERALADREKRVQDEKRRQRQHLEYGKDRLREEERELKRAMQVGKQGLISQLGYLDGDNEDKPETTEKTTGTE